MPRLKVRTGAASHAGRRGHQEDACATTASGDRALLVLADGMGGHAAGEVASEIVVGAFRELGGGSVRSAPAEEDLQEAARIANQRILDHSAAHEEARGMGSTVVTVAVAAGECLVGHAGDSRAYLVTADEVVPLTRDHSAVQEAMDSGSLTEAEAAISPYRHAILRNLGETDFPGLEVARFEAPEGSAVLLTSDGAHGFLTEAEILEHFCGTTSLDDGLEHLLRLAYHNGSNDNMTLVAAEIGVFPRSRVRAQRPPAFAARGETVPVPRRGRLLPSAVVFFVCALVVLGWLLAKQFAEETSVPPGDSIQYQVPPGVETPIPLEDPPVAGETPVVGGPATWATPLPTPIPPLPPKPTPTATPEAGAVDDSDSVEENEYSTDEELEEGAGSEVSAEGVDERTMVALPVEIVSPGGEETKETMTPIVEEESSADGKLDDQLDREPVVSPTPSPKLPKGDRS